MSRIWFPHSFPAKRLYGVFQGVNARVEIRLGLKHWRRRVERVANKIEILFKKREERKDGKECRPKYMK